MPPRLVTGIALLFLYFYSAESQCTQEKYTTPKFKTEDYTGVIELFISAAVSTSNRTHSRGWCCSKALDAYSESVRFKYQPKHWQYWDFLWGSSVPSDNFRDCTSTRPWKFPSKFVLFIYCFFTIYSRYLKRVISKRDGCVYLKQVLSSDGSLELI
jgi:hypothetical protein